MMNEPRTFEDLFFTYCFDDYVDKIDKRAAIKQAFSPYVEPDLSRTYWSLFEFYEVIDGIIGDVGNVIFRANVECKQ